jgi:hypothetical protein
MMDPRKPPARSNGKKRPLSVSFASDAPEQHMCSFCKDNPAAVIVEMPSRHSKDLPSKKPFCLLHYYTTRAVRVDGSKVTVLDEDLTKTQLEDFNLQEIFAEAYTELQQELAHESATAFQKQQSDPLSILHSLHGKPKRKKPPAPKPSSKSDNTNEGGFLRHVPLPERLLRTQQEQAKLQQEQLARMTDQRKPPPIAAASKASPTANPYQRRKPSRQSIWNLAMSSQKSVSIDTSAADTLAGDGVTCSCGSSNVSISGNVSSRNSEMAKGETWGSKDRGDMNVMRYQCGGCGKTWNQEE